MSDEMRCIMRRILTIVISLGWKGENDAEFSGILDRNDSKYTLKTFGEKDRGRG